MDYVGYLAFGAICFILGWIFGWAKSNDEFYECNYSKEDKPEIVKIPRKHWESSLTHERPTPTTKAPMSRPKPPEGRLVKERDLCKPDPDLVEYVEKGLPKEDK